MCRLIQGGCLHLQGGWLLDYICIQKLYSYVCPKCLKKCAEGNYGLDPDSQRLQHLAEEQHLCCTQNFLFEEARYLQNVPRVRTQEQRLLYKGGITGQLTPCSLAAQAGAQGSRRVNPSAKLKLQLRFMPCYSATAFQCCLYMSCLERLETHSGGPQEEGFPVRAHLPLQNTTPFSSAVLQSEWRTRRLDNAKGIGCL